MDNLKLYNAVKEVPKIAQKPIAGGRLKGMTDINPMWRIQELTNQFGPCGIGWWYVITKQWLEKTDSGEIAAFCDIDLFVELNGMTSQAIPGTGGSMFVTKESSGLHTSDECYKMALTDALSVACKALGFGANIYWNAGSKYTNDNVEPTEPEVKPETSSQGKIDKPEVKPEATPAKYICEECTLSIKAIKTDKNTYSVEDVAKMTIERTGRQLCWACAMKETEAKKAAKK